MPEDPYAYVVAAFQVPPSCDYVPGPEYPPSPDFVPEPVYPEFMPSEDEVLLVEEQPLPAALSPTTDLPGYVPESDPKEDPEEYDDEDPKEDPADYPADGGDDGDDEDESSDDDKDDDAYIEGDEEEEEHPALTTVALPAIDQALSVEETKPFETDESAATQPPHPAYRVNARISIRDEPSTPFWSDTEVARLLAIHTLPPSPLSSWSSPLPQIPSPPLPSILSPLPVSPPLLVSAPPPTSPILPLGYRAAMIRLRAETPSTSHSLSLPPPIILSHSRSDAPSLGTPPLLPIPLPTSLPPFHLLSTRADRPEVTLPPRKRLGIALGPRYEVGESSYAPTSRPPGGFRADYGFVATIDREIMRDLERDVSFGITDTWDEMLVDMLGAPATNDTELGRRMTEFTTRVRQDTDEIYTRLDDEQTEQQLMAGRLNMLYKDRRVHACTARLMEAEARMYREAWTQMTEFERQQGPAKGPAQPDAPEEAGIIFSCDLKKMAPKKRTTRLNPKTTTTTPATTSVTNAQLKAMIDQGVIAALAARDADRNTNGDDSHISGTGTEGVAGLSQWFERMESVFHISNCTIENQVKFATWTPHSVALTWLNTHVKTVGYDAAYESDKIKKYVGGLPDMIHGSIVTSKPKTMQDAVEIATELMDKKIRTFVERQTESKMKFEGTSRNTQNQQQQQNKRQNTGRACRDWGTGSGQKPTCYECGFLGHFKRECPKLKSNNNRGNQVGGGNAPAKVYAVGHAGTNPDSNVMTELGSFDAIIGKDWLVKYQAIIVCDEKIVRIPWGNETLIVHGDGSNRGNEARLHIILYTKTHEYMLKGCLVFLANVTTKETEDKSEKKRLEDVSIVRDFPKVFPKDLPGLPPTRQVEFKIDLIPGAAPVARAPYRLAPS
ncbi:putative reverse transcriptase domain-containing protein [Tanacetum coccineum]